MEAVQVRISTGGNVELGDRAKGLKHNRKSGRASG